MSTFIFALVFKFVLETVRAVHRDKREAKAEPLCAGCLHAHVQYGAKAKRAISCAYSGRVRPIRLEVLYCTDYQTREQPPRRAIGFVREIAPAK